MSHVHWVFESHNLSLEVVFLFQSFLVLTVDKHFYDFIMEHELIAPETPYIYWYAGMRYVVYLVILRLQSLLLSGLIDPKLYVSELIETYTCIMHPDTLGESLIFHLILVSLKGLKLEKQKTN